MLLVFFAGCGESIQTHKLQGATMGTTWQVTYTGSASPTLMQGEIESTLDAVNASMSTYRAESEISRFNASQADASVAMSAPFLSVLAAALHVGSLTAGAFDITVGPLVDLWGFGAGSSPDWTLPSAAQVTETLALVGQSSLIYDSTNSTLSRKKPLQLDFSSIAKGYGVDRIAEVLQANGLSNYLVEVGGEMRVSGLSPRGDAWKIAVENPAPGRRAVAETLELTDIAVATSGDYRNFVDVDGVRYSHTIDPRTGYPVAHALMSVTVLHERCMMADAWATALSVVGPDESLRLAVENDLSVLMMVRAGEGVKRLYSPAFTAQFGFAANE